MSVVEWLESPEGEEWSKQRHNSPAFGYFLVTLKDDFGSPESFLWYS